MSQLYSSPLVSPPERPTLLPGRPETQATSITRKRNGEKKRKREQLTTLL